MHFKLKDQDYHRTESLKISKLHKLQDIQISILILLPKLGLCPPVLNRNVETGKGGHGWLMP